MRTRIGAALAAATLMIALAACDSGSGSWGSGSSYSVAGALAQLPAGTDEQVMVQTGDMVAATELSGLERPTDLDGDALVAWLGPLTGLPGDDGPAPVFVPVANLFNVQRLHDHQEFADELGWSVLDADAFAERSTPPRTFTVIAGDLAESALSPDLVEIADGVVSAGEGEDLEADLDATTIARPIGAPLRLAQDGNLIAAGAVTDDVSQWLAGPEETLADDPELAAVADALDDAGVVSAVLTSGASMALTDALGVASPEQIEAVREQLGDRLPADPFQTVGIGWDADDGASVITTAYYFASEDAAEAAVPAFEQLFLDGTLLSSGRPLAELLTLDDAISDGQVVVLTLSVPDGASPVAILQLLMRQDAPFVHQ